MDPARPETWFRLLIDAVAGLHRGDKQPATTYLRFVREHRGIEQANTAKAKLAEFRRAVSWRHATYWQNNDYRTSDPPSRRQPAPTRSGRPRGPAQA